MSCSSAHHADYICVGPTAPRSFGSIVAVRTQVLRPAHARSSGSETSLHIRSLAGYIIGTLESRFRKRQEIQVQPYVPKTKTEPQPKLF
jgi:hypothetical protein